MPDGAHFLRISLVRFAAQPNPAGRRRPAFFEADLTANQTPNPTNINSIDTTINFCAITLCTSRILQYFVFLLTIFSFLEI